MAERRPSPTGDAPEAIPGQQRATFGFVGSDDYEYYEPPPATFDRQRSPVPEYRQYETSPRVSAQSPPTATGSDIGRSPQISESGFTKSRPLSPSVQYSEIHSPDPERVFVNEGEKEAVYTPPAHHSSKVPSYYGPGGPAPGLYHQNSGDRPQVYAGGQYHQEQEKPRKRPFYKRWWFLLLLLLIVVIAVAVPVGVVFGTKKKSSDDSSNPVTPSGPGNATNGTSQNKPGVDLNTSVGGQINDAFYSKAGAWNGSGIAIAGANSQTDQTLFAFYQDFNGDIQYKLMTPQQDWQLIGPVNAGSYKALNGTPLSAVAHTIGALTPQAQIVWHLFYIDEDHFIRERIITNTTTNGPAPTWSDGSINRKNFKVWQSNTIGLQACYWGNYYGDWSYNGSAASAGIHLWYASDATVFQQYSWTNGSQDWNWDRQWEDLSGNGGVGCQTWDTGMTEYVWFVDTSNSIAMYWKDNNRTANSTSSHPVGEWTQVENLGIDNVQKDSSLGYTNYMVYQADDTTIRGANVTWGAENTKIAAGGDPDGKDTFVLQTGGDDIKAVRGTHLSVTAVTLPGSGASLLTFFQEVGNDMQMYTRGAFNYGGLWASAPEDPVPPPKSS